MNGERFAYKLLPVKNGLMVLVFITGKCLIALNAASKSALVMGFCTHVAACAGKGYIIVLQFSGILKLFATYAIKTAMLQNVARG